MRVEAIVPYTPTDEHRQRCWAFVARYLQERGIPVRVGVADNHGDARTYNHPEAIMGAVRQSTADVVVICDADTIPAIDLRYWIYRVGTGSVPWVLPEEYAKLTAHATARTLEVGLYYDPADTTWIGTKSWAGVQICRRDDVLRVGWDERFTHWGADDACFGLAMDTLVGRHARAGGTAIHLWHPETTANHSNNGRQTRILTEYMDAAGDPDAMLRVIEGRERGETSDRRSNVRARRAPRRIRRGG